MKIRFNNGWKDQIASGDFPDFCHIYILGVGRADYQYYMVIFNFSVIVEL